MIETGPATAHLGRYVPRVASEWDLDAPGQRWQAVDASLVFVDISGFTSLSERLAARGRIGAEELTEVLSRVFGTMLGLAYDRGGMLLKFGGDALLLLFRSEDHAVQAASAAVEMRAALRQAAQVPTSVGRVPLRMSVGVHSGTIHLFRAGRSHHELIISGPGATTTTEMEHSADAGEILVSAATRSLLPPKATSTAKGPGWLLRWRQPGAPGSGPIQRHEVDADATTACVPIGLREHLRHGSAEPEHRLATVGFVKFQGVDRLMDQGGPAAVASALDELVGVVQDGVDAEEVTFLATDIDTDGGKIILTTGVPTSREDDEGRMLRAVRRIADTPTTLSLRIGVNRGHVFAGEVGTPFRATYTVMGDTVNLAARLMTAAPQGEVYASPSVLEPSRTLFATTALAPFHVKGKVAPVQAYAVGAEAGSREASVSAELAFVGRVEELATLSDALDHARQGTGGALLVTGPAGIGKTRLVDEALEAVPAMGVFGVRAEPYGTANPYRAFRDPVRRLLDVARGDADAMAATLRDRVRAVDPDLLPLLPLLGDVAHIDVPATPEVDALDPQFRSERTADAVVALLDATRTGPLALVVEDAQWMDDASSALLDRLARAALQRAWLLVTLRRIQAGGFVPPFGPSILLTPLADHHAEALVAAATEAAPLRPHDVDTIVERAAGSPLFLEEIVRVARTVGGTAQLPDSLDRLVSTEIDLLAPLPRRLLRYAAVLGRSFRPAVLNEILAEEGIRLDDASRQDLTGYLEPDDADRYRFRNALLRDAAYEGLSYRRRRELHLRAGIATERVAGRHPELVADVLALHFAIGQDHARALHYARTAGDRARAASANAEAAVQYERAVDAARHVEGWSARDAADLLTVLGDVREQAGLFDEALDAYRRASRLVDDPLGKAELLRKRARARERAGAFRAALRDLTTARRLLDGLENDAAARARANNDSFRAVILQAQERPREAVALAMRAADEARLIDEPEALARAYTVIEWARGVQRDPDAGSLLPDALAVYEQLGDLSGQGTVVISMGANAYFDGRWDAAVELYARSADLHRRAGNAVQAAVADMNIGEVLVNQGRLDEAEVRLRQASRVLRASDFVDGATFAETHLARALARRGDLDAAEALLVRARGDLLALGQPSSALEAAIHLADCNLARDDPVGALELIEVAAAAGLEGAPVFTGAVARVRADALGRLGRRDEALAVAREGLAEARRQHLDYDSSLLLLTIAELADDAPARAEAMRLRRALGVLDAEGAREPAPVSG